MNIGVGILPGFLGESRLHEGCGHFQAVLPLAVGQVCGFLTVYLGNAETHSLILSGLLLHAIRMFLHAIMCEFSNLISWSFSVPLLFLRYYGHRSCPVGLPDNCNDWSSCSNYPIVSQLASISPTASALCTHGLCGVSIP